MRIYYIIVAIIGLLLLLHFAVPQDGFNQVDPMRVTYLALLLLLVGSGITLQRASRRENLRNAGIWAAIIAGLALAYELLAKISG